MRFEFTLKMATSTYDDTIVTYDSKDGNIKIDGSLDSDELDVLNNVIKVLEPLKEK